MGKSSIKLLALETATEACSAALFIDGETATRFEVAPRRHTQLIIGMVDELLAAAGLPAAALDAIAFGAGPGSFTGVRIAAAVTQGIALAHDLPVARISTLAALAQGGWRESGARRLFPAIDARKQQIYWGHYQVVDDDVRVTCCHPDTLGPVGSMAIPAPGTWAGIGSAWTVYRDRLTVLAGGVVEPIGSIVYPHAVDIAALGIGAVESGVLVSADRALPIYLRPGVDESSR